MNNDELNSLLSTIGQYAFDSGRRNGGDCQVNGLLDFGHGAITWNPIQFSTTSAYGIFLTPIALFLNSPPDKPTPPAGILGNANDRQRARPEKETKVWAFICPVFFFQGFFLLRRWIVMFW
jgi:hypothetical protein